MKRKRTLISVVVLMLVFLLTLSAQASSRKKSKASVKLNRSSLTLKLGSKTTANLKVTVKGTSSKAKWSSSDSRVASVNSKGKVVAKRAGTTTITVKAGKASAKCKVTVKKAKSSGKKSKGKASKKTKNAKAHAAYKNALLRPMALGINGESGLASTFYVFDLNRDGVDELLIGNDYNNVGLRTRYTLFTYKGKSVEMVSYLGSSYLNVELLWYKKTGVLREWYQRWNGGIVHCVLSGISLKSIAQKTGGDGQDVSYRIRNKDVSSSSYQAFLTKNAEVGSPINLVNMLRPNTAANREIFL